MWAGQPTLRYGQAFHADIHVRFQGDFRASDWSGLADVGGLFQVSRKRVGVRGDFTKYVDFDVEIELRKDNPWRNVYVNVKPAAAFNAMGGKFKMPFSYDQNTGDFTLDFISRSLIGREIAPGRDIGVMARGRLFENVVTCEIGTFHHDGENAQISPGSLPPGEAVFSERGTVARVSVEPLRHAAMAGAFRSIHAGVAFTTSNVPEGLNSLSGTSVLGYVYFEPVYTGGRRRRTGTEFVWTPGRFSVKSEYTRSSEQRLGQGVGGLDLSDFFSSGWYISGTWTLTGESKGDGIVPKRPLFQGGWGAFEVAMRYDELGFFSASTQGEAQRDPRADNLVENRDRVWTAGLNWYLNKWSRIQLNEAHESFADPGRTPIPGRPTVWSTICRLQFAL